MKIMLFWDCDGRQGEILISGDTAEDCRSKAFEALAQRGIPQQFAWIDPVEDKP